jgi:hypothetical protein
MPAKSPAVPEVLGPVRRYGRPRAVDPSQKFLWSYEDLSATTGLPIGTLRKRVREGTGPRLTVVGKHHRFVVRDVRDWIEQMRDNSGGD